MKIKSVIVAVALVVFALVLKTDSVYASTTSPIYKPVVSLKKVSYYTKMRSSGHNYGLYHSGAYQTSEDNMHKIGSRLTYKGKTIHVTREQKTADGTWLKFTYNHTYTAWMHQNGIVKSFRYLSVPLIAQRPELPTGCEITATAMMLNYAGAKVSKMTLAKEMPRSSNPNKGFVGSPYSTSGWYVYPGGLKGIVKKYTGSAVNMTGQSFAKIKAKINAGRPVVVWLANMHGFPNHAVTVRGYSSSRVYYNDPWTYKKTSMSITSFQKHRKLDAYRALSY